MAAGGALYFVRMPEEFRECISPDILKELPANLDEPRTYLSVAQARICARIPELKCIEKNLPGWVRSRWIAHVLGYEQAGIDRAIKEHKPWVWATEFENVHSLWNFREPKLSIDGIEYTDSEAYYQDHKPPGVDRGNIAHEKRLAVMRKALRAKFKASKEASDLLKATYPHPLLAIKSDRFWGFHPKDGGSNLLAILLMEIRQEIMENPLRRKEKAKEDCLVYASTKRIKPVKTLNVNSFALRPYGVLGTRLGTAGLTQAAPGPTADLCAFCDPAGLRYIQEYGPQGASGASGSIYAWLGISEQKAFPPGVVKAIVKETDAKAFVYDVHGKGRAICIHVVGPEFRRYPATTEGYTKSYTAAVQTLSVAYENVLKEFSVCEAPALRLRPISGGIFAGPFLRVIAKLTCASLGLACKRIQDSNPAMAALLGAKQLDMCIFAEDEWKAFETAWTDICP